MGLTMLIQQYVVRFDVSGRENTNSTVGLVKRVWCEMSQIRSTYYLHVLSEQISVNSISQYFLKNKLKLDIFKATLCNYFTIGM